MNNYTFELDFASGDKSKEQLPNTMMCIVLKENAIMGVPAGIQISPLCPGPAELKYEVEKRKKELDQILAEGTRKYNKYHKDLLSEQ